MALGYQAPSSASRISLIPLLALAATTLGLLLLPSLTMAAETNQFATAAAASSSSSPFSPGGQTAETASEKEKPALPYIGPKSGACPPEGLGQRKEIRALSVEERQRFFAALQTLKDTKIYERFTQHHLDNRLSVHNQAVFLPWHRVYVRSFELALQQIDSRIWMPYWEWTLDSQAPEKSAIFTPEFMGGNGRASDHCVTDGPFANWTMALPKPHCLRRNFRRGTTCGVFHASESINRIITQSTSYDNFRQMFESVPHAGPHLGIGGDMKLMESPNDPIFWLHHSYVDKVYWQWQKSRPELANTYNGPTFSGSLKRAGRPATLDDSLSPFPYKVRDALSAEALCYTYPDLKLTDLGETPVPPAEDSILNSTEASLTSITPNANFSTPLSPDRTNLMSLRKPDPVEDNWNEMNGNNATIVTIQERSYMNMIDQLNALEGYVSPCSLWHRPSLMAGIVQGTNNGTQAQSGISPLAFFSDVRRIGRITTHFNLGLDPRQVVADVRARVMTVSNNTIQYPLEQIKDKLTAIIGPMIAVENLSTAGNPFGTAPVNPDGTSDYSSDASSLHSVPSPLLLLLTTLSITAFSLF